MFTFGFSRNDRHEVDEDDDGNPTKLSWFPASEIDVTREQVKQEFTNDDYTEVVLRDNNIKIIRSENVILNLSDDEHGNIAEAESQHSDLLPAIYEGGLKIWECSFDLGKYLIETNVKFEDTKILDLGCGAGVLGILALLNGSTVHFQDYNVEVIKLVTIPNVLLNLKDRRSIGEKCEFYCGDWASFAILSSNKYPEEEEKYDVIMTSETIYNPDNHNKLYKVFKERLRTNGVGYVAGKTHYFGVGGGMRQFENLVREDDLFGVEIVWKSAQGLQREIMKLTRHKS